MLPPIAVESLGGWAAVANTALLVVLALVARNNSQKATRANEIADDIRTIVDDARALADKAKSCSEDAARISKEIGRQMRKGDLKVIPMPHGKREMDRDE